MLSYLEKYAFRKGLNQHALLQKLLKVEMNKLTDKWGWAIKVTEIKVTYCLLYLEKWGYQQG